MSKLHIDHDGQPPVQGIMFYSVFVHTLNPEICAFPEMLCTIIDVTINCPDTWSKKPFVVCHEDCQQRHLGKCADTWHEQIEAYWDSQAIVVQ